MPSRKVSTAGKVRDILCEIFLLILVLAIAATSYTAVYRWVTVSWYPVIGTLEWVVPPEQAESAGNDKSRIRTMFEVDKFRDCEFKNMRVMWRGVDGTLNRLPWWQTQEGYSSMPPGRIRLQIDIPNTGLRANQLVMDTVHKCSPFQPNITTRVWP